MENAGKQFAGGCENLDVHSSENCYLRTVEVSMYFFCLSIIAIKIFNVKFFGLREQFQMTISEQSDPGLLSSTIIYPNPD